MYCSQKVRFNSFQSCKLLKPLSKKQILSCEKRRQDTVSDASFSQSQEAY